MYSLAHPVIADALQLDGATESASWADAFQAQQQAERIKARGPSPDDPLEDPTAASWVAQFNEQLHLTTTNAGQGEPEAPTLPSAMPKAAAMIYATLGGHCSVGC